MEAQSQMQGEVGLREEIVIGGVECYFGGFGHWGCGVVFGV